LIFALIASYNAHRRKEPVVAEPEEFQPFDLEALRNSGKQTEPVVQSTGGIRATNRLTSFDYETAYEN
jgi:hypothetical protein